MLFSALPRELFDPIIQYLNAQDTCILSSTCTRLKFILDQYRQIQNSINSKSIFENHELLQLVYSNPKYAKYIHKASSSDLMSTRHKILRFPDFNTFYSNYTQYSQSHPNLQNQIINDTKFNLNFNAWYGFSMACFLGFELIVENMLKKTSVDPSDKGDEAIRLASLNGHLKVVELLLKDPRVNPCARDNCAFRWAASKGHSEVVVLLLSDPRIDPAAGRNSALKRASQNRNFHLMKLLSKDERVDFYTISFIDRMRVRLGMIVNKV